MQQHYNLPDEIFSDLLNSGVTQIDMLNAIPLFVPEVPGKRQTLSLLDISASPVSKVSLMFYIDRHGDFTDVPDGKIKPHHKIAKAVFKRLSLSEQMEILEYLNDDEDEEDGN